MKHHEVSALHVLIVLQDSIKQAVAVLAKATALHALLLYAQQANGGKRGAQGLLTGAVLHVLYAHHQWVTL
jgi:hypothetical protein